MQKLFEFCSTTARAKAAYVACFPIHNARGPFNQPYSTFKFREDIMEFRTTTSPRQGTFDFVISPSLVKYGNSDGENYNERTILDKARVTI